jgi:hypothetical protein
MAATGSQGPELAVMLGGHGVDGGLNLDGGPGDSWQDAEGTGFVERTGIGVDFLGAPSELLASAARAGLGAVYLRLAWSMLEPREGQVDEAALARWVDIAEDAGSRGLEVHLVLNDGALPAWLGTEGWLLPATPERFARLSARVAEAFGRLVRGVVTVEAPASWAAAGWCLGAAPPFRRAGLADAMAVLDGMLSAHCLACEVLAAELPAAERSFIPSGGVLAELEAALLGEEALQLPSAVLRWAAAQSPGRARRLVEARGERWGNAAWAVTGSGATPRGRLGAGLLGFVTAGAGEPASLPATLQRASRRVSGGPVLLGLRGVAASVDAEGRVSHSGGDRLEQLSALVDEACAAGSRSSPARVVVGELVDRWTFGSYEQREGLIGVDRLRGGRGFRLQSTDAAGQDLLGRIGQFADG